MSVVLPALNERRFIRDCLDSLLAQDYPELCEILVVDGGSTDGTGEIVSAYGPPIRLVPNHRVTAAAAMNVGIADATGDVICRADAHSLYASDYVSRTVDVLCATEADNVGGPMRAVGTTSFGRAVAAITSSPFGVGPGRFHYSDVQEEVDTVYLGTFRRATLEALGGYDETNLQWAAEDQELNLRLRADGGRIVLDPSIRSWYFPRADPRSLARQYFNYGICKASTLAKHRNLPSWRPLAPAGLVAASAALAVGSGRWRGRLAIPVLHVLACMGIAGRVARDPGVAPHRALAAIEICHWTYGAGFWVGVWRWLSGRGFDTRPSCSR